MIKKIFWAVWIVLLIIIAVPVVYLLNLPNTSVLATENPSTWSIRTVREEQMLERGRKPHPYVVWKNLSEISPHLAHAVVLSEDDTFFEHNGFDVEQLKRAIKINWERKRFAFGASTITQQLARTLYLSPRKNLLRKVKEAFITVRLEKTLPKKRILELYLNVAEWGPQVYGAEAASQHFFGKPALDLTPDEAIALAVILPSPRRWNPLSDKKFIAQRKSILFGRMVRAKYLEPPLPPVTEEPVETEKTAPMEEEMPIVDTTSPETENTPPTVSDDVFSGEIQEEKDDHLNGLP